MPIIRHDNVLAGTLALTLLATAGSYAFAQDAAQPAASAASTIPLPESAGVAPPTAADVTDAPALPAQAAAPAQEPAKEPAREPVTGTVTAPAAPAQDVPKDTAITVPPGTPAQAPADAASTTPATLAPVVAAMDPKDAAIAEQIRGLVNDKLSRIIDRRKEKDAATAFYLARGFAPLWTEKGEVTKRAREAMARIRSADNDGLEVDDFTVPEFAASGDPSALAEADLKLTNAVLTYARQAQIGRLTASRVSANTDYKQTPPEPAEVLNGLGGASDIAAYLDAFNPQFSNFKLLRAKLIELRGDGRDTTNHIATGDRVKPGQSDPRIPAIRTRLGAAGEGIEYDKKLAAAVRRFQNERGLRDTGVIDDRTIAAFNGPSKSHKIDTIVSNLERLRWLPREVGKAYVMVNLPDYSLKVVNNGQTVWKTRIVVGKPAMATPIFSNAIENIVVNPSWHVPESIIYNEYMPAMAQDPTVLSRMGFKVDHNRDGSISITQPPGDRNALGHMKFNFPNKYNVYLHDTPDKNLFKNDLRAYSHGCMRVLNPWDFGDVLTSIAMKQHYTAQRFKSMFGTNEHTLTFETKIPVHLTYQTAYVDEDNKLVIRDDIYGLDGRVAMAMKNPGRTFAEAPEKKINRKQYVNNATTPRRGKKQEQRQARGEPRPFNFFDIFSN